MRPVSLREYDGADVTVGFEFGNNMPLFVGCL